LGDKFSGCSNCSIAKNREVEAIGTNAHELPMVYSALAKNDADLARAPYDVLDHWQDDYDGNLRIILPLHKQFQGRVRVGFGWGTLLTNDFRDLVPDDALKPFSLVCKAIKANGAPTVKLSDNVGKAMGPESEIERYRRVFKQTEQSSEPIVV